MNTQVETQGNGNVGNVVGDHRTIELPSGRTVSVYLCKVRHIGRVAKVLAGMVALVSEVTKQQTLDLPAALKDDTFLLRLMASVGDDVYSLVALLSDIPYENVLDLALDDAVVLLAAVLQDNYDFFMKRVAPLIPSLLQTAKVA